MKLAKLNVTGTNITVHDLAAVIAADTRVIGAALPEAAAANHHHQNNNNN